MRARKRQIESVRVDEEIKHTSILTGSHVKISYENGVVKNRILPRPLIRQKYEGERRAGIESVKVDEEIKHTSILTGNHVAVNYEDGSVKHKILTAPVIEQKYGKYLGKSGFFTRCSHQVQDQASKEDNEQRAGLII